jgi:hypothetical protein
MTVEEVRRLINQAATDPEQARRLITIVYGLSVDDPAFTKLLSLFLGATMMWLIEEHADQDDDFACRCGAIIRDLMDRTPALTVKAPTKARSA